MPVEDSRIIGNICTQLMMTRSNSLNQAIVKSNTFDNDHELINGNFDKEGRDLNQHI